VAAERSAAAFAMRLRQFADCKPVACNTISKFCNQILLFFFLDKKETKNQDSIKKAKNHQFRLK
jgi:hypothetical protein